MTTTTRMYLEICIDFEKIEEIQYCQVSIQMASPILQCYRQYYFFLNTGGCRYDFNMVNEIR